MPIVFSENPEIDLWRELLQFSYEENIKRYWEKRNLSSDTNTINSIAGSFLQAYEYYNSVKDANLQISPLLLYYGSANLLYGMVNLLSASINKIDNHGMKLIIPDNMNYIADTKIRFNSPKSGGIHVISKYFDVNCDLTNLQDWNLYSFFDSIAEVSRDYNLCYDGKIGRTIMLDVFSTPDGKVEKVYFDNDNKSEILSLFSDIEDFYNSYLRIDTSKDYDTGKEYFILRHKLNGHDISEISYSGQPYLKAGHRISGRLVALPTLINMYISLFALASLCRYYPEFWSPFVLRDTTGEKLFIEKLLFFARRMIPNFVLDGIIGERMQYSFNRYTDKNTIKLVGEHQVQEMIDRKFESYPIGNRFHDQ